MSGKVKLAILAAVLIAFSLSFEAQNMAAPLGWYIPGSSLFRSEPAVPSRSNGPGAALPDTFMTPVEEL